MFSKIIAVCLVEMVFWGYFWNIYGAPIETVLFQFHSTDFMNIGEYDLLTCCAITL